MNKKDEIIENGYIKIENGLIAGIGDMSEYTDAYTRVGTDVIDAKKMPLYPGFIDAHAHVGMIEDSMRREGNDVNESTDPSTPHVRAVDAINPMDRCFEEAARAGVTSIATGPGSSNPVSGQFAAVKTCGSRIDDMLIKAPLAMKMAMGENPKMNYGGRSQSPYTRMATASIIRNTLFKAKKYLENINKAQNSTEEKKPSEPEFDIKHDALVPVLKNELEAHIHAHRADDIFTAIRIAKEFGIKYTVIHCTEGHLIAKELAAESVKAVIGPIISSRSKPELKNATIENAAALYKEKVLFSISTDHPVVPIQYLPYCAALAVKGGLPEYEAIKAITINPAVILGLDDIIGSLEIGKHADLCVYDGSPLDILNNARLVLINGKKIYGDI